MTKTEMMFKFFEKIEDLQILLEISGNDIICTRGTLNDAQKSWVEKHKDSLLEYLVRPDRIKLAFEPAPCGCTPAAFYIGPYGAHCWHCDEPAKELTVT